jgi:hypothetical protein
MKFPNLFKIIWWLVLLLSTSVVIILRYDALVTSKYSLLDLLILFIWICLLFLPIISELSFLGIKIKKDIENVKKDIITELVRIQATFNNNLNINANLNLQHPTNDEIKSKRSEDAESVVENGNKNLSEVDKSRLGNDKAIILSRVELAEVLAFQELESELFQPIKKQIKFNDRLIVDGYYLDGNREVIVEIKYTQKKDWMNYIGFVLNLADEISKANRFLSPSLLLVVVTENLSNPQRDNAQVRLLAILRSKTWLPIRIITYDLKDLENKYHNLQ